MDNIPAYWCAMALSLVLCAGLSWMLAAREEKIGSRKAAVFGLGVLVLGGLLGLACAKTVFMLIRFYYASKQWFPLLPEEMSYYGGVAGVCAGAWLAGRLAGIPARLALNTFAPAGALLAALARFAEYFLGQLGTHLLDEDVILPPPLGVTIDFFGDGSYYEYFLAVFVLEGVFSLIAMLICEIRRDEPDRFLRTLFYLCLPQILFENLRDTTIAWLFVKVEQLMCYLVAEAVLVWYGIAAAKKGRFNWIPAIVGLAVCGTIVLEEFILDGKLLQDVSPWIPYTCMIAGLILMAVMEHLGRRQAVEAGA